jgi:GT2 family glycosyltransferase
MAQHRPVSLAPKLSIGLPVYNAEEFLPQALDCLLAQTFRNFEIIISDNASTDRTPQICRGACTQGGTQRGAGSRLAQQDGSFGLIRLRRDDHAPGDRTFLIGPRYGVEMGATRHATHRSKGR